MFAISPMHLGNQLHQDRDLHEAGRNTEIHATGMMYKLNVDKDSVHVSNCLDVQCCISEDKGEKRAQGIVWHQEYNSNVIFLQHRQSVS